MVAGHTFETHGSDSACLNARLVGWMRVGTPPLFIHDSQEIVDNFMIIQACQVPGHPFSAQPAGGGNWKTEGDLVFLTSTCKSI